MINIIKAELIKILYFRIFWIFILLYALGFYFTGMIVENISTDEKNPAAVVMINLSFPEIWHIMSYLGKYLMFMPGLLLVLLTSQEYSNKTLKQGLINGMSEKDYIIGKEFIILLFILISTIFMSISVFIFGNGEIESEKTAMMFISNYVIYGFAFLNFIFFASNLIKNSILVVVSFGAYFLFFESIIASISSVTNDVAQFLPQTSILGLINNPFWEKAKKLMPEGTKIIDKNNYYEIKSLIWSLIFIISTYFLIKKRDL